VKKHPLVKSGGNQKLSQKDIILVIIMNRWRESSSKIYRTLLNALVFTGDQERERERERESDWFQFMQRFCIEK
jgi:hypothetical protein